MQKVHIDLAENSYNIVIGNNLPMGELIKEALPKCKDLLVVTNETIAPLYLDKVQQSLEAQGYNVKSCILKDGEAYKNVDSYMQIMTSLMEASFARDCALVALGGGVVGDMTGFAASTYQRGVDFVQVPTTLLALVDSSVGGKTAINHPLGKNMIGSFYQPKAVIADIELLKTLNQREIAAGMAEVIKYGVLFDKEFFDYLDSHSFADLDLGYVVKRCCELKAMVVSADEKEKGQRALLNLGHTFGHAIEVGMGFGTYLHGEAVAIGMAIAAYVGSKTNGLAASDLERIIAICKRYGLPIEIPSKLDGAAFIEHMRHDKKVKQGHITYIIPKSIGDAEVSRKLDDETIIGFINEYKAQFH